MKDLNTVELPELRDGRLVVRPWRPDDAAAVAAIAAGAVGLISSRTHAYEVFELPAGAPAKAVETA